jgi:hypothetical protein
MSTIKKITRKELAAILGDPKAIKGCTFIGFDAMTVMELQGGKANPHVGNVLKEHKGQVAILFSDVVTNGYENMVRRRQEQEGKEGDFEVGARSWGEKLPGTSLVQQTPKNTGIPTDYLQVLYNQSPVSLLDKVTELGIELNENDTALIDAMKARIVGRESKGEVSYLLKGADGKLAPIEKDAIQGVPPKKSEGKQGGLSEPNKVIVRTFKLASLTRVTMGGVVYLLED